MKTIVLVGIGGSGMSGLAGLLLQLGYDNIVGIDAKESATTQSLEKQGIRIFIGHGQYTVQPDDIVIYSHATVGSVEVTTARTYFEQNHIKSVHPMLYAQFLGELSKYCITIAVTGTHGKSSTSSLVAYALQQNNPLFGVAVIGAGVADRSGKNYALNQNHAPTIRRITDHIISRKGPYIEDDMKQYYFVIEADEYNKHFLHYDVDYGIIINCDIDHIDTYGTKENYYTTFLQFAQRIRYTLYIPQRHDAGTQWVCTQLGAQQNSPTIKQIPTTHFNFTSMLGGHNHSNASLAYAVVNDISEQRSEKITHALTTFTGLTRRAEPLGKNNNNILVLSDYGHHPVELASTIKALKEKYPDQLIHALFQPHQITRVVNFWDEFKQALSLADQCYITPIYAARENFNDIKKNYPDHAIQGASTLQQFDRKTAAFWDAHALTTDQILETIHTIDTGIIVVFTAGDVDGLVRNAL